MRKNHRKPFISDKISYKNMLNDNHILVKRICIFITLKTWRKTNYYDLSISILAS